MLAVLGGTAGGQSFPAAQEGKSASQQCLEIPIVQNINHNPFIPYVALFPEFRQAAGSTVRERLIHWSAM